MSDTLQQSLRANEARYTRAYPCLNSRRACVPGPCSHSVKSRTRNMEKCPTVAKFTIPDGGEFHLTDKTARKLDAYLQMLERRKPRLP